mmetsp:Transcript_10801/g.45334  ORF Transcript_10801/g.45334 Transcript_10801/m.45334 type:complete len:217 (+) Transcript_10801:1241-1891(+)
MVKEHVSVRFKICVAYGRLLLTYVDVYVVPGARYDAIRATGTLFSEVASCAFIASRRFFSVSAVSSSYFRASPRSARATTHPPRRVVPASRPASRAAPRAPSRPPPARRDVVFCFRTPRRPRTARSRRTSRAGRAGTGTAPEAARRLLGRVAPRLRRTSRRARTARARRAGGSRTKKKTRAFFSSLRASSRAPPSSRYGYLRPAPPRPRARRTRRP